MFTIFLYGCKRIQQACTVQRKEGSRNQKNPYAIQHIITGKSFSTWNHPEKGQAGKSKTKGKCSFKNLLRRFIIDRNKKWNVAYPAADKIDVAYCYVR